MDDILSTIYGSTDDIVEEKNTTTIHQFNGNNRFCTVKIDNEDIKLPNTEYLMFLEKTVSKQNLLLQEQERNIKKLEKELNTLRNFCIRYGRTINNINRELNNKIDRK